MALQSLAKLHEKAVSRVKSLHRIVSKQDEFMSEATKRGVATLVTLAAGAGGALVDYYGGTSTDPIPCCMVSGVPVVAASAAATKVAAFVFTGKDYAPYLHDAANGAGSWALGAEIMRLLKNQSVTSTSTPAGS